MRRVVTVSFCLPKKQIDALTKYAKKNELSRSEALQGILNEFLK